ncbi:MAG: hypothetical protein MRK02_13855 [Candidatus Scalindua sp.]|nr:hypothetical protein [Candidatus Scalindua sp.]
MKLATEAHKEHIRGVLSCYGRIVIQGTLPSFCFAEGMTSFQKAQIIRIFDYSQFVQPLRDGIIENAQHIAQKNNLDIEYTRKKNFRKEDRIQEIIKQRGAPPGLVHIFSELEPCTSTRQNALRAGKPWHDKKTHRTFLKYVSGKCLHYYFYLIHEILGLCYIRVPTWCPFRLQIYFNGHSWLAAKLKKHHIKYQLIDNAFFDIAHFKKAQHHANNLRVEEIHDILDTLSKEYCPVVC